ncbi:hypothetical protein CHGG_08916 [Chaetomium globosum CBS 148.51]|uniref:non-specific serine/threonine protein kinase n=1 Tax=Chaetomium globosum (strain ATCC 6205 / CBS 148.51 / DSM 1962 / NBRC 6347 / NRRL 1970) TaxID=306901 RepID=Q2GSY8_CHAGB|nr:uncharacterized protein CHGG_08916 [Chaetomium globosum CBS 148.51]EAQ84902.1 hypothetical protein CHGG_08916 [Chaetomium globosum CBS 148.51]
MTTLTTPTLPKASYVLFKPLDANLFLARRTTDGEILLARPLDPHANTTTSSSSPIAERTRHHHHREHARLTSLLASGAAAPAANLLNHENIVSIHDELVDVPLHLRGQGDAGSLSDPLGDGSARRMFLWDFPNAGTLRDVLEDFAPRGAGAKAVDFMEVGGFLPESFVWHVGLGLLRALQWLHEGVRDTYAVVPHEGSVRGFKRLRGKTEAEADWMPVLHRGLKAENVFLQLPKGFETYGAVKLGSFEKCYISGSVAKMKETPVVAMETEDGVSLGTLRERKGRWMRDGLDVARDERPYTRGSELFAVGAMLYRMMCGRELPPTEECPRCDCVHLTSSDSRAYIPCPHDCVGDVNINTVLDPLFNYTTGLKNLVTLLLRLNRNDEWAASDVLNTSWPGFEYWAANTEDGKLYRDIFDDIWLRKQNQSRLKKRRRVEEEEEEEEEFDGMDLDDNVLLFQNTQIPDPVPCRILPPPPPLLLTKRVTSFLRANLSPHIHSAMLTTPAGSLLAHASNLPASALRRQAAVAASLWALQGPSHTGQPSEQATSSIAPGSTVRTRKSGKHSPPTVTVQLDSGAVFVIRRLRCGMLFICMGGAESAASDRPTPTPPAPHITRLSRSPAPIASATEPPTQNQQPPDGAATADPSTTTAKSRPSTPPQPSAPPPTTSTTTTPPPPTTTTTTTTLTTPTTTTTTAAGGGGGGAGSTTPLPGSPSQASILSTQTAHTTGGASTASTATVSGGGASASLMRRQVEELARWLDERLGGLCVPEEGIGMGIGGSGGVGVGAGTDGLEVR